MKRGPNKFGAERKFQKPGAPWRSEGGGERRSFGGGRDFGGERRDFGGDRGGERGGFDREGGGEDRPQRRTYRREGGMEGGYGRPAFNRDRDFGKREGGRDFGASPKPFAPRGPQPVAAKKLVEGVAQANKALADLIESFGKSIRGGYDISELEITCSFDNDGRFMGFGVGGAVSMTLTITPLDAEEIMAREDDEAFDGADFGDDESADVEAEAAGGDDDDVEAPAVDEEADDEEEDDGEEEEITVKS